MRAFVDTCYSWPALCQRTNVKAAVKARTRPFPTARGHFSAALAFLDRIRRSEEVQILHADPVLQAEAWDLFGVWGASGANAVDCVSFAVMKRMGIRRAFTFDAHFRAPGFEVLTA